MSVALLIAAAIAIGLGVVTVMTTVDGAVTARSLAAAGLVLILTGMTGLMHLIADHDQ